jgi:hypothetical protein
MATILNETIPGPVALRAGPLSLLYENGYVRSIRVGDREMVRRIYMALRDDYWNTIPGTLENVSLSRGDGSFFLTFDSRHRRNDVDFLWRGEITGNNSGELAFAMHGIALSGFRRNRIGLCALHPLPVCKGTRCQVETVDGDIVSSAFPEAIAPYRVFDNVRALTYPVTDGLNVTVRFEGDVFETEDQRNWTDATYKTYSTPLSLPVPVVVEKGTIISQKIVVTLDKQLSFPMVSRRTQMAGPHRVSFAARPPCHSLPSIGVVESQQVTDRSFASSACTHRRIDLRFETDDMESIIAYAHQINSEHGTPVELALHCTGDCAAEVALFARLFTAKPFTVARFLVYKNGERSTSASTVTAVRGILHEIAPDASIVGGTNGYFVEINRSHPPVELLDGICFSATPQVHTFDDCAIMENLTGLFETVSAAKALAGDGEIVLSPLTLRPRSNPALPQKDGGPDSRMQTLFGAAWILGAIAKCMEGKASGVTFGDVTPGTPAAVFLAWLHACTRMKGPVRGVTGGTASVCGIGFYANEEFSAVAANLTNKTIQAEFTGLPERCECSLLEDGEFGKGAGNEGPGTAISIVNGSVLCSLPAYAVVGFMGENRA